MEKQENEKEREKISNENILEKIFFKQNSVQESDRDKLTREWLSKKYDKRKTEFNQSQIYAVTTLESLANQWFIKPLKWLLNNFRINQLSKNRGTAKELVNIFKNNDSMEDMNLRRWGRFLE